MPSLVCSTPASKPIAFAKYVAAGCLFLQRAQAGVSDDQWTTLAKQSWNQFGRHDRLVATADSDLPGPLIEIDSSPSKEARLRKLPSDIQDTVLKSALVPFSKLFARHWIELELGISIDDPAVGIIRAYLLPDDIDRGLINRDDAALRKAWVLLLSTLNFSQSVWQGESGGHSNTHPSQPSQPRLFEQARSGTEQDAASNTGHDNLDGMSLLQLFNTIPSPNPQPEQLVNDYAYEFSLALLESKVSGLHTTLYPYQRRSAALMLQREAQPVKVVDPRLSAVVDQNGVPWYYDAVTGTVLRDARFYDGVCGGILAEEMGAGKTLICLALILATRHQPAYAPEIYGLGELEKRSAVGSLADMAAAAGTRASFPFGLHFSAEEEKGLHYTRCIEAVRRNPGYYLVPRPEPRRKTRKPPAQLPPTKVYLSRANLVIVPTNLLQQWRDEIVKHTSGLQVLVLAVNEKIPSAVELLQYDLVLFSISRFERLLEARVTDTNSSWMLQSPIAEVHFKRVIVDEGHKLGNSRIGKKSNILLILEHIQTSAQWIVTGTPSTGLFGLDDSNGASPVPSASPTSDAPAGFDLDSGLPVPPAPSLPTNKHITESSDQQERRDLERIGAIASLYLNARPWANTLLEGGDTPADWSVYVMQPKHSSRSAGRSSVLRATLESLIIRHRKSEIGDLLPPVNKKVVYLDGSYQDKLTLNLFSMMIIFNSVQSQRTDQDFFFHPRQRKSLLQLVSNLRQSSFFGGSFFSAAEILKAVETAAKFLEAKKFPISDEDDRLLREATSVGEIAVTNRLKDVANRFHEVPVYVRDFPGRDFSDVSRSWSLDGEPGDPVCTDAPMLVALQRFVRPWLRSPNSLEITFQSGKFAARGDEERRKTLASNTPNAHEQHHSSSAAATTLAGNTKLGAHASPKRPRSQSLLNSDAIGLAELESDEIAEPLANARLVSTASAKLSYLLDSIMKYQDEEKIIVFYESDNVAWYIAGFLEVLHVHHLIYAKSLTTARRAQYIATFNESAKFRVMLMDLTQAAFGLDMRSASRIYFINPVLNPQVEAQAIGRVRRISQKKGVSVETLVLRGSLEEVIIERQQKMTQAEHRQCKSILDDRPIYDWFLNARIIPLPLPTSTTIGGGPAEHAERAELDGPAQMAPLSSPLALFGRGSGRVAHPDEDLVVRPRDTPVEDVVNGGHSGASDEGRGAPPPATAVRDGQPVLDEGGGDAQAGSSTSSKRPFSPQPSELGRSEMPERPAKKNRPAVRFADVGEDE